MKRKLYLAIGCLFAAVFVFSSVMLFTTLNKYRQADAVYSDLQNRYVVPVSHKSEQFEDDEKDEILREYAPISVNFEDLLKENGDIVGWLYSENTPIDYPVVQAENNEKYLRRDLNGNYIISGTIFVDFRCPQVATGQNYIIYGHNMRGTTMFSSLAKYKDPSYYDEHPVLYYLTPNGDYKIELFAGMVTAADSEVYTPDFGSKEAFKVFLKDIRDKSTFYSDVAVTEEDNIITLSTCSYEFGNARYAVFGKLTDLSDSAINAENN
ncbi:MAG: class B sortase [Oscillospiraceae bacterium]|nr:class B sortase [Oscillospiraceae bacterium]